MFGFNHIAIENYRKMAQELKVILDSVINTDETTDEALEVYFETFKKSWIDRFLTAHKWYNLLQRQDANGVIKDTKFVMNAGISIKSTEETGKKRNIITYSRIEQFVSYCNTLYLTPFEKNSVEFFFECEELFKQDPIHWLDNMNAGFRCINRFETEIMKFLENDAEGLYEGIRFIDNCYILYKETTLASLYAGQPDIIRLEKDALRKALFLSKYVKNSLRPKIDIDNDCFTTNNYVHKEMNNLKDSLNRMDTVIHNFATENERQQLLKARRGLKRALDTCINTYEKICESSQEKEEYIINNREDITITNFNKLDNYKRLLISCSLRDETQI